MSLYIFTEKYIFSLTKIVSLHLFFVENWLEKFLENCEPLGELCKKFGFGFILINIHPFNIATTRPKGLFIQKELFVPFVPLHTEGIFVQKDSLKCVLINIVLQQAAIRIP